ncbi:MAG: hypothetical protein EBE86_024950 [Hormoscilla sp. GUM202]|nr:hypothetical protein [Hormoscilla sp. GUM202]
MASSPKCATRYADHFFLTSLASVLAFVPWIVVIVVNLEKVVYATIWQNKTQRPPLTLDVKSWLGNITRQFVDFGLSSDNSSLAVKAFIPIIITIVLLSIYAMYFAYKSSPKRISLFLVTLSVVPWLVLALPDLISGHSRGFREVFLYDRTPSLISEIEQQYNLVPVSKSKNPKTGLAWL